MSYRVEIREERARMVLPDGRSVERTVQVRIHPLTGDTVRVLTPPHRPLRIPDLVAEYGHTREHCPFCPAAVEAQTPSFSPGDLGEPRIRVGEVRVFPSLLAYAGVCAVSVLTREHFVGIEQLSPAVLSDAFAAARIFFDRTRRSRPDLPVRLLHWNYMPPAGSSILHPHHQMMATAIPPTRLRRLAEGADSLRVPPGDNPWEEVVRAEREAGKRWLGEHGPWRFFVDPAPQGRFFEWVGVHRAKSDLADLDAQDYDGLIGPLLTLFRYLASQGLWSFNLALMGLPEGDRRFRCQVRLVPRAVFPPAACSDIHFDVIEHEPMVLRAPEEVAEELRAAFRGSEQNLETPGPKTDDR